jgi:hypothetical protein
MFLNIEGSSNNKALEMPIKLVAVTFHLQHQKTKQWRWAWAQAYLYLEP